MRTETERRQAARQRIFNRTAPLHDWHVGTWEVHCFELGWSHDPEDWTEQDQHDWDAWHAWKARKASNTRHTLRP